MEQPTEPVAYMPGETPILMADWSLKPLSGVRPGEELVGWVKGTTEDRGRLVRSAVQAVHEDVASLIDVRLASGNPLRCARNALWFTNRFPTASDPRRKQYAEARPGSYLMQFDLVEPEPSLEKRLLWAYLAGMVDGEGHIADSSLPITQTTTKNGPVWNRLRQVLDALGISYQTRCDRTNGQANWSPRSTAIIRNVRDEYRRMLRYANPAKAQQINEALWRRPSRPIRGRDKILSLTLVQPAPCLALSTTTGNFVAWGYGASTFAQSAHCPQGHLLAVRTDSANKTYRSCPACPPDAGSQDFNATRRAKSARNRAEKYSSDDLQLLAWAAESLRTGKAQATRRSAGLTQAQMSGRCRTSQGMISGWECGNIELKGASGIRYAHALAEISDRPT